VVNTFDKKFVGDIEPYVQQVDFQTFLAMYGTDEIADVEIEDLLNIDLENISALKDKTKELIEACNGLEDNENQKEELLIFFGEKLNDLQKNETNLHTFITHVDKVDTLVYYENKTQVNFNI
jgi:hypothetical protein